jgi:hypothetical protein
MFAWGLKWGCHGRSISPMNWYSYTSPSPVPHHSQRNAIHASITQLGACFPTAVVLGRIGSPPCQCLLLAQRVVQPGAKDLLCTRARELSVSLRLHARHECGCGAMHPHAGTAGVYYPSPPLSPPPCLVVLPLVGVVNPARTHMRTTHTDNSRTQQV